MPGYYSEVAYNLADWARQENNRVKASRIKRTADRIESRYRKYHKLNDVAPYGGIVPYGVRPGLLRPPLPKSIIDRFRD